MKTITISREFGSRGRELGEMLAKELGYYYFDSEIIRMVAEKAGVDEATAEKIMDTQKRPSYSTILERFGNVDKYCRVLEAQSEVMMTITTKYNCVIVGRFANYLTINEDRFSIFVHASTEAKLKRLHEKSKDPAKETDEYLLKKMKEVDDNKRRYHKKFSDNDWEDASNYNLTIDSTGLELEKMVKPIADYIRAYFGEED